MDRQETDDKNGTGAIGKMKKNMNVRRGRIR